jgi:hypothetical protein
MSNKTQHNKKGKSAKKPEEPKLSESKKKTVLQKQALLQALEKSLGIITTACKQVGLNRSTFYDYYNNDQEFKKAVDDLQEVALDFAESKLLNQISKGDTTATIFYLKTKGKNRGYIEKQQIEGELTHKNLTVEFI